MAYLIDLTIRIAAGVGRLPEPLRLRHAHWLAAQQRPDGGFAGRQGPSDLYYTSFGLRGLAMLGALGEPQARLAVQFLQEALCNRTAMRPADFISLIYSAVLLETLFDVEVFAAAGLDRRQAVMEYLRPLQRPDGGYAKSARSGASSTYQTFLAATSMELIGLPLPQPAALVNMIRARRRSDGGFVEMELLPHSGTNPTAAAIGLLSMTGGLDDQIRQPAADLLAGMQNTEGGLRANLQILVADLLSSFTGLVALNDLEAVHQIDAAALARYATTLEQTPGGFSGGAWDRAADVEYTFYGLGVLGLLEPAPKTA